MAGDHESVAVDCIDSNRQSPLWHDPCPNRRPGRNAAASVIS